MFQFRFLLLLPDEDDVRLGNNIIGFAIQKPLGDCSLSAFFQLSLSPQTVFPSFKKYEPTSSYAVKTIEKKAFQKQKRNTKLRGLNSMLAF